MEDQDRVIGDWDSLDPDGDAARQAKVNALGELKSASEEELRPLFGRTLMPSILDKAFKGEL